MSDNNKYRDTMRFFSRLLASLAVSWIATTAAASPGTADATFEPDAKIGQIAQAYSLDAVEFCRSTFHMDLDWSDGSIAKVETALAQVHESYRSQSPAPRDDRVMTISKMFGSYVGEVYRRNHGATWGMVTLGGEKFPGLRTEGGTNFWPWGRAFNRIKDGPENNIRDYYDLLLRKIQADPSRGHDVTPPAASPSPPAPAAASAAGGPRRWAW